MLRIAINGYGRIGRAVVRALFERGLHQRLHLEAVNDLGDFATLAHQQAYATLGLPLLAGWSRKSSLGAVTGLPVEERMPPSVAAAVLAVERGASIVRVHDVRETAAALAVWRAMQEAQQPTQQQAQPGEPPT